MTKQLTMNEWVRRIDEEEMPVFAHTARELSAASKEVDTPVTKLAHLILQDSAMTARVLRLANSVYYNPSGQAVNTISRAILFLGFDVVRNIALTVAIIDPLRKGMQQAHFLREMARSFHAAVQAKAIAQKRGIANIEEVFIATLLYRLGHLAFWCFPFGFAKALDEAYQQWDDPEQAESSILGFPLRLLTQALNGEWHLSRLLGLMFSDLDSNGESQDMQQAYELVMAVEEGWGSLRAKRAINDIATRISLSLDETTIMIKHGAREAVQVTREFGIEAVGKQIPLPEDSTQKTDSPEADRDASQAALQLQMEVLRELTTMLHDKVDINAIVSTVMEGIYRALGMERLVLAFIAAEDGRLKAKYHLGDDSGKLKRCFDFPISEQPNDFLSYMLKQKDACWLNNKTRTQLEPLINTDLRQCLGVMEFFVMPIRISSKGKGIIYADCKYSGRALTSAEFQTFTHFSEHINIAFDLLMRQK